MAAGVGRGVGVPKSWIMSSAQNPPIHNPPTQKPSSQAPANHVELLGRVSAEPESRVLPSGDQIMSFRIIVNRDAAARRRSRQTVDTVECTAWTAALRKKVARLAPGTVVQVGGQLRSRFSRTAGGVISRVTVDLDACAPR